VIEIIFFIILTNIDEEKKLQRIVYNNNLNIVTSVIATFSLVVIIFKQNCVIHKYFLLLHKNDTVKLYFF
jgi:hypothetical protein